MLLCRHASSTATRIETRSTTDDGACFLPTHKAPIRKIAPQIHDSTAANPPRPTASGPYSVDSQLVATDLSRKAHGALKVALAVISTRL